MPGACIDIGSNTTRLLVAACDGHELRELHQERAFTRLGRELSGERRISPAKIAEISAVVGEQLRSARRVGADDVHAVATAALRQSTNRDELVAAIAADCGLELTVLSGLEEARLAFLGAAGTLGRRPDGSLGVVDVGGGSCELVVGEFPDRVAWSTSLPLGSGMLADGYLRSDPPTSRELDQAGMEADAILSPVRPPPVAEAIAVGGSATSLRRVAGPVLDPLTCSAALELLGQAPSAELARRFGLHRERVRLLPAGLLILRQASELFAAPLQVGNGGVREGVLLEACRAARGPNLSG